MSNENDYSIFEMLKRYKDKDLMISIIKELRSISKSPINIMEVCGGQTFALARYGIEPLLPPTIKMIHGPGCPVCVTPTAIIDEAVILASMEDVIFCTFGDMMRVPGSNGSLLKARSEGADVRMFYSPLDVIRVAKENPQKKIIFFAIGFETTAPIYALMLEEAVQEDIHNLYLLTSLFTVPAAIYALSADNECNIDALLAAGHVCAITGTKEYEEISAKLNIPIVVTGFEPVDLLQGILMAVRQFEDGIHILENAYPRVVSAQGNTKAQELVDKYFTISDQLWRGLGVIPKSGLSLRQDYELYDCRECFSLEIGNNVDSNSCISGEIMKGKALPKDCKWFGNKCTPLTPIGAPMVSSEGVCAAYHKYKIYGDES